MEKQLTPQGRVKLQKLTEKVAEVEKNLGEQITDSKADKYMQYVPKPLAACATARHMEH